MYMHYKEIFGMDITQTNAKLRKQKMYTFGVEDLRILSIPKLIENKNTLKNAEPKHESVDKQTFLQKGTLQYHPISVFIFSQGIKCF